MAGSIQSLWVRESTNESTHEKVDEFAQIYSREFDYVWETVRRLGARARDQEDLVHDVFLRVHGSLGTFDHARPMRPWLFGIAFRVVSEERRSGRNRFEVNREDHEFVSSEHTPEQIAMASEARVKVNAAVARLPSEQQFVFVAHELCDVSIADLVELAGVPLNTLYSRLRLARVAFANALHEIVGVEVNP
ncbi:MAG: sigma-70 family RNA polymerase sigma factor [Sandaracinaceae bacterium]|jgi:RNA polymerase sigma-70 factor (ECF subfamily)|nr:sigma-70 family RNA polymerase sigma factor [Sandaracinaceae bacterium]